MKLTSRFAVWCVGAPVLLTCLCAAQSRPARTAANAPAPDADALLVAMKAEMERSKAELHTDQVARPYYIEYDVTDTDEFIAEASFGRLRIDMRNHRRTLNAVVRIGDYKQDSFLGRGVVEEMPLSDDPLVVRHQLWLATDRAYKAAAETYAAKLSSRKQLATDDAIDDFAQSTPIQHIEAMARLQFNAAQWCKAVEVPAGSDRRFADFIDLSAAAQFTAVNRFYVNSEGTVTRTGQCRYQLSTGLTAQASDGMLLARSPAIVVGTPAELPSPQRFADDFQTAVDWVQALRKAPVVSEEYRGPVLILTDASNDIFADLVSNFFLGTRPPLGNPARTAGPYANAFKNVVLPDFLTIVDNPLESSFRGESLIGHYAVDDEGVASIPMTLVDGGRLVNYLIGRTPIRDFSASNGHGRSGRGGAAAPAYGNLFVKPAIAFSREELKKKMLDLCRERHLDFGYLIETFGGITLPRLIYRVYVEDGRQELVRGTTLDELDARSLRNELVAAGNDPFVSNRPNTFQTVICPSLLFRELVVKPANQAKGKLPEYPPPHR